jgi:3D (Asp-Asp-Asp) domain-containing protein
MVAADPRVWPIGSRLHISTPGVPYSGVYTVTDVGRAVKGREIDIFVDSCRRAKHFGKRLVHVRPLRR